ncbi:MAG: hypothetical protein QOE05_2211 [Actinomycetota bacterium]|jgi:hypothetical protein|nr:hypothetical protein [Actinomycetota bacterium]
MTTWHAPPDTLVRYAQQPSTLDEATASSIEMHVLHCAACREAIAAATEPSLTTALWDAVADRVDAPRTTVLERLLRGLGLGGSYARLVAATPSLQLSWLAAMSSVVALIVAMANKVDGPAPFLVLAPIIPLASVVAAFAAVSDPSAETASATPLAGAGLALRRAVAVLTSSCLVLAVGAAWLPGFGMEDAAWVLPSLALSLGALALGTWLRVEVAAGVLAFVWFTGLAAQARLAHVAPADDLAPFSVAGQLVAAALAIVAVAVMLERRDTLATIGSET